MGWRRGAGGGLERDGPLILDEGYGVYVKDLEGNEYIDRRTERGFPRVYMRKRL